MAVLPKLNKLFEELEAEVEKLTKANAELTQENLTLAARKRYLTAEVATLVKQEETAADTHVKAVEIQAAAIRNLETDRDNLQAEIKSLEDRKSLAETDLQLVQTTNDEETAKLSVILRDKKQEITDTQVEIDAKSKQLGTLWTGIDSRKDLLADLDRQVADKYVTTDKELEEYDAEIQHKQTVLEKVTVDLDKAAKWLDSLSLDVIATEKELIGLTEEKATFETKKQAAIKMLEARESSIEQREEELKLATRRAANKGILDKV